MQRFIGRCAQVAGTGWLPEPLRIADSDADDTDDHDDHDDDDHADDGDIVDDDAGDEHAEAAE